MLAGTANRNPSRSATISDPRPPSRDRLRISERTLIKALGVDRLELYLLMAALHLGRYDSVTHLLYFTAEEADRVAAELGKPTVDWTLL